VTSDPKIDSDEDQMHLSYSNDTGYFAREDINRPLDESTVMMKNDPHNYFNEKNAIMLNVRNPT
jgi:hypothetical protein